MGAAAVPLISSQTADLVALKTRQQAAWSAGDYAVVGTTLQIVGETLCEALDLRAGQRVLDVATGNGNVALAAARRGGDVVATDYVFSLLDRARLRATADGLPMEFKVADAEQLPFGEFEFDVVVSTFGVMFTADHARAAAELMRVCRPGGKIGLANWTPEGFIGQVFRVLAKHVPPPAAARSPALWGTKKVIVDFFQAQATSIKLAERAFTFRYRSSVEWLEVFRTYYGPMLKAFATLQPAEQMALERDLLALVDQFNTAGDGTMVVPAEYLEIVITKA